MTSSSHSPRDAMKEDESSLGVRRVSGNVRCRFPINCSLDVRLTIMATQATKRALDPEAQEEAPESLPAHEQIATLAYALWQERGCPEGSPEVDWFRAEQELKAKAD